MRGSMCCYDLSGWQVDRGNKRQQHQEGPGGQVHGRHPCHTQVSIKRGWRWFEDGLYWWREWEQEDEEKGDTQEARASRIILDSKNSILGFLTFTMESPSDFQDGKLPTLDIEIWKTAMQIWYEFYQKPMSNNVVLQEKSALSENVKVSSLTEEVVRRLHQEVLLY